MPVCVIGAGMSVLYREGWRSGAYPLSIENKSRHRLSKLLRIRVGEVASWNDWHSHSEVLERIDSAITRLETKRNPILRAERTKSPWGWGPLAKPPVDEIKIDMNWEIDRAIDAMLSAAKEAPKETRIPVGSHA